MAGLKVHIITSPHNTFITLVSYYQPIDITVLTALLLAGSTSYQSLIYFLKWDEYKHAEIYKYKQIINING